MPLVYYRDPAYIPIPTGNAYALLTQIDPLLVFHAKWLYLDTLMREDAIVNASAQIDIMSFTGEKFSAAQPLQFPRQYNETSGIFSIPEQDRKLVQALSAQIEYNLNRMGIGIVQYAHGNESMTPRQDIICREAQMSLGRYLRD